MSNPSIPTSTPSASTSTVPNPPSQQIVVAEETRERLVAWKTFFRRISSRIRVIDSEHENFERWHGIMFKNLKRIMGESYTAPSFPTLKDIAFFIGINSSLDDVSEDISQEDTWIFTYGDRAFQIRHFTWDGEDRETGTYKYTFSISTYGPELLTWQFITEIIAKRLKEIEGVVPLPPETP